MIETLRIIAATALDIRTKSLAIGSCLEELIRKIPGAEPVFELCPVESFVPALLDQIIDLASDGQGHRLEPFGSSLLAAGSAGHVAIEEALLSSLALGLGDRARPMLLNAWGAAFWLLVASNRIQHTL